MSSVKSAGKISVLILAVTLVLSLASPPAPITANGVPYWDLEQNGVPVTALQVGVGDTFTVDVWIRGILSDDGLTGVYLVVTWDPAMMALDSHEEAPNTHNWEAWHVESLHEDSIDFYAVCGYGGCTPESAVTAGVMVLSLHFRCLGQGSSQVMIRQDADISGQLHILSGVVYPPAFAVTCNQIAKPVGGVVMPTNRLEILTPYIALAGLIAVMSAVAVVKRRRD